MSKKQDIPSFDELIRSLSKKIPSIKTMGEEAIRDIRRQLTDDAFIKVETLMRDLSRKINSQDKENGLSGEILPIENAPKDGTPILVRFTYPENDRREAWAGKTIDAVMSSRAAETSDPERHHDLIGWGFAAPVGYGGIPDSWCQGYWNLPENIQK